MKLTPHSPYLDHDHALDHALDHEGDRADDHGSDLEDDHRHRHHLAPWPTKQQQPPSAGSDSR
eukprot:m.149142 g.149142  ORF g.149142 m.149142 type:complete len:63 (+) comp17339_c2_seq1:3306-3494(+)